MPIQCGGGFGGCTPCGNTPWNTHISIPALIHVPHCNTEPTLTPSTLSRSYAVLGHDVTFFCSCRPPLVAGLYCGRPRSYERCIVHGLMVAGLFSTAFGRAISGALYVSQSLRCVRGLLFCCCRCCCCCCCPRWWWWRFCRCWRRWRWR